MTGTIKNVNTDKGFGFIVDSHGVEYFFHRSGLKNCRFESLRNGALVSFVPAQAPKGPRAEEITLESD